MLRKPQIDDYVKLERYSAFINDTYEYYGFITSIDEEDDCVEIYKDLLEDVEGVFFQKVDSKNIHAYQSCVIRLDSLKIRNYLLQELRKVGIQTQFGTYSSVCQPIYDSDPKLCPNSVDLFHQTLAIPLFDELTEEQIKIVSENIIQLLRKF